MAKDWRGDIVFSDNVAIFRGHVGPNKAHGHWASQITIAIDGKVEFEASSGVQSADAVYFSSKTEHSLFSGFICSIYFDPLNDAIPKALNENTTNGWAALTCDQLPEAFRNITADTDLNELINSEPLCLPGNESSSDDRLQRIIHAVKTNLSEGSDIDRDSLAKLINLSPTRFSHWFVERTGVPLRSYKKWLKLRVAMDALLDGKNPMEAAMLGGFSDLAHMAREFSDSFGLTYLDAQKAWEQIQQN